MTNNQLCKCGKKYHINCIRCKKIVHTNYRQTKTCKSEICQRFRRIMSCRDYSINNKDKIEIKDKKYYKNNKSKIWQKRKSDINYKKKELIRKNAREAIKKGLIKINKICTICRNNKRIELHHPDYSKPLEVIPLCHKHHMEIHRKMGEEYE